MAAAHFPVLVRSSSPSVASLDIANTASSIAALQIIAGVVIFGMQAVIAYTVYVHRGFREGGEGY